MLNFFKKKTEWKGNEIYSVVDGRLKKIEKVYDVLRCSPVKSSSAAKEIEQRVFKELDSLERAVSMGDEEGINTSAETLYALAVERNYRLI